MRLDMDARPFDLKKEYLAGWNIVSDGGEIVGIEGIVPGENAEANARLMAAAPDLLEALEGAIGALEQDLDAGRDSGDADWEGIAYQRLEAAKSAIAKALQP